MTVLIIFLLSVYQFYFHQYFHYYRQDKLKLIQPEPQLQGNSLNATQQQSNQLSLPFDKHLLYLNLITKFEIEECGFLLISNQNLYLSSIMYIHGSPASTQADNSKIEAPKRHTPSGVTSAFNSNDTVKKKVHIDPLMIRTSNLTLQKPKHFHKDSSKTKNEELLKPLLFLDDLECENTSKYQNSYQQQCKSQKISNEVEKQKIFYSDQSSDEQIHTDKDKANQKITQKYEIPIITYQPAPITMEHKMLIRAQSKIDEHIHYLKIHRGRKTGQFFKVIKKTLLDSLHIIIELHHFKQIIYLDPELYQYSLEKDSTQHMDVLINLPNNADLTLRKLNFKKNVHDFVNQTLKTQQKNTTIPYKKLSFQQKIQLINNQIIAKRQSKVDYNITKKINLGSSIGILDLFNKQAKFKQSLLQRIVEKEARLKQLENAPQAKKYGLVQVQKVLDEIQLIFMEKKISNLFRATLLQIIMKRVNRLSQSVVKSILQFLCSCSCGYLKKIQHPKGLILQVERKLFHQLREQIKRQKI